MHSKLLIAALVSGFAWPALAADKAASSPLTYNIGFVSDYIVRGITQTTHNPALQGGADYTHSSGVYLGAWASNVGWVKQSGAIANGDAFLELDTYLGLRDYFAPDWSYDVGVVRYNFLGSYEPKDGYNRADTLESYAGLGYKWFTLKYSYSMLDGFLTTPGTKGTNYLDFTAIYPFGDSGISLTAHYGKQTFVGTTILAGNALSYDDYKVAVSEDFSSYVLSLVYTDTNVSPAWTVDGKQWGKSNVMLSLTHSF
jgi:uncharacterized protein (TIGR02001 family)